MPTSHTDSLDHHHRLCNPRLSISCNDPLYPPYYHSKHHSRYHRSGDHESSSSSSEVLIAGAYCRRDEGGAPRRRRHVFPGHGPYWDPRHPGYPDVHYGEGGRERSIVCTDFSYAPKEREGKARKRKETERLEAERKAVEEAKAIERRLRLYPFRTKMLEEEVRWRKEEKEKRKGGGKEMLEAEIDEWRRRERWGKGRG